jgi:hypothetical protein
MILEYFSLEKGPFTRPWGRLEKFLAFYFIIITSPAAVECLDHTHSSLYPSPGYSCSLCPNKFAVFVK